ncbi:hypothetical protein FB107DRAFT_262627 [Schizophyllum commune]
MAPATPFASYHSQRAALPNQQSSLRLSLLATAATTERRIQVSANLARSDPETAPDAHRAAAGRPAAPTHRYADPGRRLDSAMTIDTPSFFESASGDFEQMMSDWPKDGDWLGKSSEHHDPLFQHPPTQQGTPTSPAWSPASTLSAWSGNTTWLSTSITGQCTDDCFVIHCDDPGHPAEGGCSEPGCATDASCDDAECSTAAPCDPNCKDGNCEGAADIFCTDPRCVDNTHCDECCELPWLPQSSAGDFGDLQFPSHNDTAHSPRDTPNFSCLSVAHRDHIPTNIPGAPVLDSGFVAAAMRDPVCRRQLLDIYLNNMYPDPAQRPRPSYATGDSPAFDAAALLVGSSLVTPLTPPMYYTDTTGVTRILRPADLRPDPARGLPGLTSRDLPRGHMFDGVEYPCAARLELEEAEEGDRRGRKRSRDVEQGQQLQPHPREFEALFGCLGHAHAPQNHQHPHDHQHSHEHQHQHPQDHSHQHHHSHAPKRARGADDRPMSPSAFAPLRIPPHLAQKPELLPPERLRGFRSADFPHTHIIEGVELPCMSRIELEVREELGLDSGSPSDRSSSGVSPSNGASPNNGASPAAEGAATTNTNTLAMPELALPSAPAALDATANCMWAGCHRTFTSVQALAAHVNAEHLALVTPADPLSAPICQWNECALQPQASWQAQSAAFSPDAFPFARQQLAEHFLQHHLGVSQAHATMLLRGDTRAPGTPSRSPSQEPGTGASTDNEEPAAAGEHDCATAAHVCQWRGCKATFDSCAALTEHLDKVHVVGGRSRYDCFWGTCERNGERGFSSKQKICRHLQTHTGHRPFTCSECGQHFSEAATLAQHMRRHTRERPYKCDHPGCGKAFAIMGALTIHKRTHNGDKPFKCGVCGKAFAESSNLSKHQRTHTGLRPFACAHPGCGKAFARVDQLNRHMNVHTRKEGQGSGQGSSRS